jgi:spermidine synthase
VRFFMLFTAGMCTLPATLGMGAMFPLTLELWSQKANDVGRDVGTVYSANTVGSILGAWLPGFILLPRLGMETTLHAGMMLNAAVALGMSYAALRLGVARTWARALCSAATGLLILLLWLANTPSSPLAWNLSHMTLGAFRVSLAHDVLDPTIWGKGDLLYYRDGVSTTVSVERWGAHLSLKNNGKVDASNGDDMPTQIMVAAYPLLLHARGPKDLDVAIVGFGSGVTVGAALSFPVRHVDAMELEASVVDAASRFFGDVNHLPRKQSTFPLSKLLGSRCTMTTVAIFSPPRRRNTT